MIVWGGLVIASGYAIFIAWDTGAHYSPRTDQWTSTSTNGTPTARWHHTAVWTGQEMIVWGGENTYSNYNTGARYTPGLANPWSPLPMSGAPEARSGHTAVWDATQMLTWGGGGSGSTYYSNGARYNPRLDQWTSITTNGAPARRTGHSAVWTGSQMIIANGGDQSTELDTVYSYAPPRTVYLYLKP